MNENPIYALLKTAAGGEDGQDSTFEQSMSQIADVVIRDKAPALSAYEVGFQLLERDSDEQRAVGVKMYKVGKAWLLVPVFFLKGEVKGTEILYLKDQDVCVPLQEDWIRHVFQREAEAAGRMEPRGATTRRSPSPSLLNLVRPPMKYAAAVEAGAVAAEWDERVRRARPDDPPSLVDFVKAAGRPAARAFAALLAGRPGLAAAFEGLYEGAGLTDALKTAAEDDSGTALDDDAPGAADVEALFDRSGPVEGGRLSISGPGISVGGDVLDESNAVPGLPAEGLGLIGPAASKTAADGDDAGDDGDDVVVRDSRSDSEVSRAIPIQESETFENPAGIGIYDVITGASGTERCLVIPAGATARGSAGLATVVRLSDKRYGAYRLGDVWIVSNGRGGDVLAEGADAAEWDDLLDDLPDADADVLDAADPADRIILLGTGRGVREASAPFRVTGYAGSRGGGSFRVDFQESGSDRCWGGANGDPAPTPQRVQTPGDEDFVALGWEGDSRLRDASRTLMVPTGYKALRVRGVEGGSAGLLARGQPELYMTTRARPRKLTARKLGPDYEVDGERAPYGATFVRLVVGYGLRDKNAREVLDAARAASGRGAAEFVLKSAAPGLSRDLPYAPGFPDPEYGEQPTPSGGIPIEFGFRQSLPVDSMAADPGRDFDAELLQPPADAVRAIQRAMETGRRDVVDATSVGTIGGILSARGSDAQIDRFLPAVLGGCNATGRLLMSLFWHREQFGERYGDADVPALEDQLRDVFVGLGKLFLNLKQKTVKAPLDVQRDIDLDVDAI